MSPATTDAAATFLDVRGHRTQVFRKGEGRPALYLHAAFGEAYWTDFDEELSRHADWIHLVLPGFEGSEGLADMDDAIDVAFHVLDALDALGIERAAVAGSSIGGWIAAEAAVLCPDRVSDLVLVGAAGIGPPSADPWATKPAEMADLLFATDAVPLAGLMKALDLTVPQPAEILLPLLQAMEASARIGWNPHLHDPKLAGRLHRVRARTLVVRGERDGFMPAAHAERYASLVPGARLETIPGCGHLPSLEAPGALAGLVRAHLGLD